MSELIANTNLKIKATPNPIGSPWIPGDPNNSLDMTLTTEEASAAMAEGNKILVNTISWVVIPGACQLTSGTHVSGASTIPIFPDDTKVRCDYKPVLREGDFGRCNGIFIVSGSSFPCSCFLEIDEAGQTTVRGE
jgi:hypothetical protein